MNRPAALVEIEPLERQTLGERAYAQLCDLLVSGRLAPGEKVSLRSAASALGVSMMPVREAVSRLVADRALEVTPNRSVRVPVMSVAQFRDLAGVRIAIEGHAAAEAARLRTDGDLLQIGAVEAAFRRQSTLPDPDAGLSVGLNKDFHFAVYAAAASPLLVEIIRGLWLKAGPVLNLDLRASPERLREGGAVRFHADALAAIRRRDGDAARAAIAADITGAADFIISRGALAP
ncbi:GntR family transcriptional regulator [Alsobacter sp. KACC 23698]|uniref:GntR family transcriptional regulator n=1 Tax=Alsobacter sp. KACC 23698 TaxID=3149229 RepID=A0AAU7JKM2_9HYPH